VAYIIDRPVARLRQSQASIFAMVIVAIFLALVTMAIIVGSLHWVLIVVYLLASIVTYLAYANDKLKAQKGYWRTKETTLLLLGLAGGWPGALIAQHRFHHKTQKGEFQVAYWLTVGLNCAGLLWLRSA
jgi:uncharacterized membrane protein YsdA (DUF1294 family)